MSENTGKVCRQAKLIFNPDYIESYNPAFVLVESTLLPKPPQFQLWIGNTIDPSNCWIEYCNTALSNTLLSNTLHLLALISTDQHCALSTEQHITDQHCTQSNTTVTTIYILNRDKSNVAISENGLPLLPDACPDRLCW